MENSQSDWDNWIHYFKHDFWLPAGSNLTWPETRKDFFIPHWTDLWVGLALSLGLTVLRMIWERYIGKPFAIWMGLKNSHRSPPFPNKTLEERYSRNDRYPDHKTITGLCKQLDCKPRYIQRWWKSRQNQDRLTEVQKFSETSWRFIFYVFIWIYGVYFQYGTPCWQDVNNCWNNYPNIHVNNVLYWYYMLECGFYISLLMSLYTDCKRKDFKVNVIHHVVTLFEIYCGWVLNFVYLGGLIMLIHDTADPLIELAKMFKYVNYQRCTDWMFLLFTLVWIITRTGIFPFWILWAALKECYNRCGSAKSLQIAVSCLLILQFLHIWWTYMIARMCYRFVICGTVEKDGRSDTEDEDVIEYNKKESKAT